MNQLTQLLNTRTREIMSRENHNDTAIYLYPAGNYWVAFEKSAYQLARLHPECQTYPVHTSLYPFPIVIASLPLTHITPTTTTPTFSTLTPPTPSLDNYQEWHDEEIMELV